MNDFSEYSKQNLHFYLDILPELLKKGLLLTNQSVQCPHIVDVGSGDGRLIFALYNNGYLNKQSKVVAVDISEERVERLKRYLSSVQAIQSDATNVNLPSTSFDLVICSQVIEHVSSDIALLQELKRLLKPNGLLFLSSVIRKPYGIYFYHKNGRFLLDPTHTKEYSSSSELTSLMERQNFKISDVEVNQISFPIVDIFIRMLIKCRITEIDNNLYFKHKSLRFIRRLVFPVLGYANIDVLAYVNN